VSPVDGADQAVDRTPRMAVIPPYAASVLLTALEERGWGSPQWRGHELFLRSVGRGSLAAEVEFAVAQLKAAAAHHGQQHAGRPISASGSAQAQIGPEGASSLSTVEISTREAATMIGVTVRQVRYWLDSGALSGRKVGRDWLADRRSVEALRDVRRTA